MESFDGKMLYYLKPGQRDYDLGPIWKVPARRRRGNPGPGSRDFVVDWALRPEGIYFSTWNGKKYAIEFLSFQTGKITPFYQEETPNLPMVSDYLPRRSSGFSTVSTPPFAESDLMLVENFR